MLWSLNKRGRTLEASITWTNQTSGASAGWTHSHSSVNSVWRVCGAALVQTMQSSSTGPSREANIHTISCRKKMTSQAAIAINITTKPQTISLLKNGAGMSCNFKQRGSVIFNRKTLVPKGDKDRSREGQRTVMTSFSGCDPPPAQPGHLLDPGPSSKVHSAGLFT